jgi:hypothetical protein
MDESVDAYGSHLNGLKTLLQIEQNNTRKQYACSKKSLFEFLPQMQTVSHLFKIQIYFAERLISYFTHCGWAMRLQMKPSSG